MITVVFDDSYMTDASFWHEIEIGHVDSIEFVADRLYATQMKGYEGWVVRFNKFNIEVTNNKMAEFCQFLEENRKSMSISEIIEIYFL